MIIESLSNSSQVCMCNPRFKQAFDYISKLDLRAMEVGRYEIDGTNIFMMIDNKALKSRDTAALEVHDKYIDIQIVIAGREGFGWKQRQTCQKPRSEMDSTKDIQFFDDAPSTYFELNENEFVIFLPSDAHAPLVGDGEVKKCIIKVLV